MNTKKMNEPTQVMSVLDFFAENWGKLSIIATGVSAVGLSLRKGWVEIKGLSMKKKVDVLDLKEKELAIQALVNEASSSVVAILKSRVDTVIEEMTEMEVRFSLKEKTFLEKLEKKENYWQEKYREYQQSMRKIVNKYKNLLEENNIDYD